MSGRSDSRAQSVQSLNARCETPHGALQFDAAHDFAGGELARYRMANGLNILLLRDTSAPVVAYHSWFGVGSRHEKPGKTGLAHLFEHLMFNETESLPAGEFDRTLEAAGGEVNAATWVDWTYYHEAVPASELPLVVRLEADRMAHLVLRDPQVSSEKEVVANERRYRVEDDVEGFVNEQLYALSFDEHPYHWPTIGWMKDIENFTTEDCRAFYDTYYAPNNATVVVVGDFEEPAVLALLSEHYGPLSAADLPEESTTPEPAPKAERRHELTQPTPTEKLQLGYRAPGLRHDDYQALSVANEILFGGRSSRLYRALISEGEVASEARGGPSPFKDEGLFEIWVGLRAEHTAEQALAVVDRELERLANEELPAAELDKAKNRMELHYLQGMETAGGKAEQIGFYETVLADATYAVKSLELTRAVTAEQVKACVARYLRPERRTTLLVRPEAGAAA